MAVEVIHEHTLGGRRPKKRLKHKLIQLYHLAL